MSVNKKYFWLKMEENFFNQKEIKKLRRVAGGDTYVIIYLKMSLISLKEGGKLYYEGIEDSFAEELAYELDESVDNVKMTISFLQAHNMIEAFSNEELFMNRVEEMTGKDTDEAKRKRRQRNNAKLTLEHNKGDIVPQLSESVQDNYIPVQERTPELEIEIETELEHRVTDKSKIREEEKNAKKENIHSSYDPHANSLSKMITAGIKHWNSKSNLPVCRYTVLTLPNNKLSDITNMFDVHRDGEILKAINNLSKAYDSEDPKYRPKNFQNFIVNSLDNWFEERSTEPVKRNYRTEQERRFFDHALKMSTSTPEWIEEMKIKCIDSLIAIGEEFIDYEND